MTKVVGCQSVVSNCDTTMEKESKTQPSFLSTRPTTTVCRRPEKSWDTSTLLWLTKMIHWFQNTSAHREYESSFRKNPTDLGLLNLLKVIGFLAGFGPKTPETTYTEYISHFPSMTQLPTSSSEFLIQRAKFRLWCTIDTLGPIQFKSDLESKKWTFYNHQYRRKVPSF